jgi:hypothetical protein
MNQMTGVVAAGTMLLGALLAIVLTVVGIAGLVVLRTC